MATPMRKLRKALKFNERVEETPNKLRTIRREEEITRLKAKIAGTKTKAPKAKPTKIEEPSGKDNRKKKGGKK